MHNCLRRNLLEDFRKQTQSVNQDSKEVSTYIVSENISIYVDVWCSLNKRFQQRMYDPNYDLLKANWSLFQPVEWLLPVLTEYNDFRSTMNDISEEVYSWSNQSDVLFIADYPGTFFFITMDAAGGQILPLHNLLMGLYLENFINDDLSNVSLTVLEGDVVYEVEDQDSLQSVGVSLKKGESIPVEVGLFHKIHTVGKVPACYMYTFIREEKEEDDDLSDSQYAMYSPFPLIEDVQGRARSFVRMWGHIGNSILYLLFGIPYQLRSKIKSGK